MSNPCMSIHAAVSQLAMSPRGRKALRYLLALMQDGGLGLDLHNLAALEALIAHCRHSTAASVTTAIQDECDDMTGIAAVECRLLAAPAPLPITVRTVSAV